jgi:hypothetical protein
LATPRLTSAQHHVLVLANSLMVLTSAKLAEPAATSVTALLTAQLATNLLSSTLLMVNATVASLMISTDTTPPLMFLILTI